MSGRKTYGRFAGWKVYVCQATLIVDPSAVRDGSTCSSIRLHHLLELLVGEFLLLLQFVLLDEKRGFREERWREQWREGRWVPGKLIMHMILDHKET